MVRKFKDTNDWDPWIKLQQSPDFWEYFDNDYNDKAHYNEESEFSLFVQEYPDYMRKAVVLALSIAKWHRRNPLRGSGECACCKFANGCNHCYGNKICGFQGSLYYKFSQDREMEIADQIYDMLRADYDLELLKIEKREAKKR